jgi:hypothetical protein
VSKHVFHTLRQAQGERPLLAQGERVEPRAGMSKGNFGELCTGAITPYLLLLAASSFWLSGYISRLSLSSYAPLPLEVSQYPCSYLLCARQRYDGVYTRRPFSG